jgi:hypothetical protein
MPREPFAVLRTAYEPNEQEIDLYEALSKKDDT